MIVDYSEEVICTLDDSLKLPCVAPAVRKIEARHNNRNLAERMNLKQRTANSDEIVEDTLSSTI